MLKVDSINITDSKNATPEVLAAWQKEYPSGVFELATGELKAWIRKPTRNEMRELTAKKTDPITYSEIALDMLWLGGDAAIKTDDEAFYSVSGVIQNVLDIKEAELKKL